MTKIKKVPFWEKALEMVKGGDKARMRSFTKENIAALNNQILIRSAEVSGLETQIKEKDEHFVELALKIDTTKLGSYKDREKYIKEYNKNLSEVLNEQTKLEVELKIKHLEIERFEKILKLLEQTYETSEEL